MVVNMRQGGMALFMEALNPKEEGFRKCLWKEEMSECVTECLVNILCNGTPSTEKTVLPRAS